MARVLTCIDPEPAADGTCAQTAWIEVNTWADFMPDVQTAVEIGIAYMGTLMVLTAVKRMFKPTY